MRKVGKRGEDKGAMMEFKNYHRKAGSCIEGDKIYVQCNQPKKWKVFPKSQQHRGSFCKAEKDAKAIILRTYTNIKK